MRARWSAGETNDSPSRPFVCETRTIPIARRAEIAVAVLGRMAELIEQGERAPDFEPQDRDGNPVQLSDFRGRTVVLYFYPKADRPGD
jgi:AhpC/TSA family